MPRMSWRAVIWGGLVCIGLWQSASQWRLRAVHPPDGALAPQEPLQTDLEDAQPLVHGRWTLTPRARYDITARILSREDYRFDTIADLVPEDLALGWGAMSDNRVLRAFRISQSARFYTWQPITRLPIPHEEVIEHSANTHVIPEDAALRAALARLRIGQVVHLTGLLVDGVRDDGVFVHTSLTRSDTGAGACEIMLVQHVEVL
jgi:hypothetical protein